MSTIQSRYTAIPIVSLPPLTTTHPIQLTPHLVSVPALLIHITLRYFIAQTQPTSIDLFGHLHLTWDTGTTAISAICLLLTLELS